MRNSAWSNWARENLGSEYERGRQGWLVTPYSDVKLVIIDSVADFYAVLHQWGKRVPFSLVNSLWFHTIDFERIAAAGYDGLHLTEQGNSECHLITCWPYGGIAEDLNAWDVKSTCWFRWCFTDVRPAGVLGGSVVDGSLAG